jgi:O-antigen/teichoic acid export membrane protein
MTPAGAPEARTDPPPSASVARSSTNLLAANVAGGLIAFLFVVAIARTIGPSGRGVVAFATTVPTAVSWITILGLDVAFLYLAGAKPELRPSIASVAVTAGLVTGIVGSLAAIGLFTLVPTLVPADIGRSTVLIAAASTPLFSIQRLLNTTLIGSRRIRQANAVVVSIPATSLAAFMLLGLVGSFSVQTAISAWVIGRLMGAIGSILLARRSIGLAPGAAAVRSALRPALSYGLRAYVASLSMLPIRRFDTFMLAAIGPSSELGLYTAGVNIAEVSMYLPNSVANVMLPESAGRGERASALLVHRASAVVLSIMLVGALVAIAVAPLIVHVILGSDFSGSVVPLQLMMVAMVGTSAGRIYAAGLLGRGRAGTVSVLTLITMCMVVLLDLALIPGLGAVGAALASAIGYCCGGLFVYVSYRQSIPESILATLPPLGQDLAVGSSTLRKHVARRVFRRT